MDVQESQIVLGVEKGMQSTHWTCRNVVPPGVTAKAFLVACVPSAVGVDWLGRLPRGQKTLESDKAACTSMYRWWV